MGPHPTEPDRESGDPRINAGDAKPATSGPVDPVTDAIESIDRGDPDAAQRLFPLVYDELRGLAGSLLSREAGYGVSHTLQATALVNEAYLKLASQRSHGWSGRSQFLAVAAGAMRRILIDHARRKKADKRAAPGPRVELSEAVALFEERAVDLVALDEALVELAQLDQRKASLVEFRFFGGLTMEEAAAALGVPLRTAERDWTMARAWLKERVVGEGHPGTA